MQTPREAVRGVLDRAARVVILTHINPDPDAIARAVALRYLLHAHVAVTASIGYRGTIGRAENRALVCYLRRPLPRMSPGELEHGDAVLLVDTQPGMANCSAGPHITVCAVIDHHPTRVPLPSAIFADIRPDIGATATIITDYLQAARLPLSTALATALFYGIKSDALDLMRERALRMLPPTWPSNPRLTARPCLRLNRLRCRYATPCNSMRPCRPQRSTMT